MAQIPQYNVDSGDFTPEEILDVIPEQERLDRQVQNDEERYLRELEKNADDRIRNSEKMWKGISKLSSTVENIFAKKQEEHRKKKTAALKNRILLYGVGDNLKAHFSGEKRDLFEESEAIHETASTIERSGDIVTAEEFRDLSKWEQYAVQEEYARKIGLNYGTFVENARETVSIDVTDPDGTVRTVKFANGDLNAYQPTEAERAALNEKIQFEFAYQLQGIDNEALIAEQVRPHVLAYNKANNAVALQDRINARKNIFQQNTLTSMETIITGGNLEEGTQMYQNYIRMYKSRNPNATNAEAEAQFGMNLVSLVENGKVSRAQAIALIEEKFVGRSGERTIEKSNQQLRTQIEVAGIKYDEAKKAEEGVKIAADVSYLKEMGPISEEQADVLKEAFEVKYGYVPPSIKNAIKGYVPDDQARAILNDRLVSQNDTLHPNDLRNVSTAIYNEYKKYLVSEQSHLTPGTGPYKDNATRFDSVTQTAMKTNYGQADIKSNQFLNLRATVEAKYNDAYQIAYAASKDENIAHKMGMQAVNEFVANPDNVAAGQIADYTVTTDEKQQVENVSIGVQQGMNNQWKTNRMSLAGEQADKDLLTWAQSSSKSVKDMPEYYVKVARALGIPPDKFGLAQAALITQEPFDESALSKEMTEDKDILKLIFKNPNTYSVIQGVMMLEQEGTEVTKENSLFNNKSVRNEDI